MKYICSEFIDRPGRQQNANKKDNIFGYSTCNDIVGYSTCKEIDTKIN